MKNLYQCKKVCFLLIILLSFKFNANCQNQSDSLNGIEALSYFKSKAEDMILSFAANIPETSNVYKKYNFKVNMTYNELKARYLQYRAFMKSCILANSSIKKLKDCLKSKNLSLKNQLDSLQGFINEAYVQQFIINPPTKHENNDTSIDVGATTPDLIASLISALTDGAIKIWTQINTLKKGEKDAYITEISSKEYDLADYYSLIASKQKKK
jgi:hypothetical protein